MFGFDRSLRAMQQKLERNDEDLTTLDCLKFPFDVIARSSESTGLLGESLRNNTVVTELVMPLSPDWTEHEINNDLNPMLCFIESSKNLCKLTYMFYLTRVDLTVVKRFFVAVGTARQLKHAIDLSLIVDVGGNDLHDPNDFQNFESLMQNTEDVYLNNLTLSLSDIVLTTSSENLLDHDTVVAALHGSSTIESLSLERVPCKKFFKVWKEKATHSNLRAFSLELQDRDTLLQVLDTLPELVRLQKFHMTIVAASDFEAAHSVLELWRSKKEDFLQALKQNGSLFTIEIFVWFDGPQLDVPQVVAICKRNEAMPKRMTDARVYNPDLDVKKKKEDSAVLPTKCEAPLSCFPKLFHQSLACPAMGPSWMLRGLVLLGDAVGPASEQMPAPSPERAIADEAVADDQSPQTAPSSRQAASVESEQG